MAREVKRAGSRKTVTTANLVALGAERLATILMETAEDEAGLKRRLRMELAGEVGADHLAAELNKRLVAIEVRRSRVHWRKYAAFARDLDLLRGMISGRLAQLDPKLALEFLWRFLALTEALFRWVDDGRGHVETVFRAAVADIGALAHVAKPDNTALAERVAAVLEDDDERVLDGLVAAVLPTLEPAGVGALRAKLSTALRGRPRPNPALRAAVQMLADAEGDVEAYMATFSAAEVSQPLAGAQIARRLLKAGRTEDALAALSRSEPPKSGRVLLPGVHDWEDVFLDALEADGQVDLAQELRWAAFEKRLAADRLRAFLKRLPDFDDIQAEDRALAYAGRFSNFTDALRFFIAWSAPAQAADLILSRPAEIDAGHVEVLEAAVPMLDARYPLAASLVLRAMVADILRGAQVHRYKVAQRQLAELETLDVHIEDWAGVEPHTDFVARLARIRRI
ncbi:MAG TPA: hypothetical protein VGI79_08760 [Caulobacteraceae bacterium]|jgi:hypothetical protein